MATKTSSNRIGKNREEATDVKARNRYYQRAFRQRQHSQIESLAAKVRNFERSHETISTALAALSDGLCAHDALRGDLAILRPIHTVLNAMAQHAPTLDPANTCAPDTSIEQNSLTLGNVALRDALSTPKLASIAPYTPTDVFGRDTSFAVAPELSMITNYAHLERSFARNLHRTCLYRTLEILRPEDLTLPSSEAASAFTIATQFFAVGVLRSAAVRKLFGPTRGHLDDLDVSHLNIGGSGTHFPRLDVVGNPLLDAEAWAARRAKQYPRHLSRSASSDAALSLLLADGAYQGEWFDPNDVEQYLESYGLQLTGNPSIARFSFLGRPYVLDLSQFAYHLSTLGICLGRSPGFRRNHIKRAIFLSSFPDAAAS